jgi:hypothetical protein
MMSEEARGTEGPILIVVPPALLSNWYHDLIRLSPAPRVCVYRKHPISIWVDCNLLTGD